MRRITKDEYFLALSNIVSTRATCDRLWAGCVLVLDGEVVATGYNGAPSGLPECDEVGHLLVVGDDGKPHCKRTLHAETNALYQAKRKLRNLEGATAYVNTTPCEICLGELLKWGIRRIVCGSKYANIGSQQACDRMVAAWGAILEYHPMPDVSLTFGTEVGDVKKVSIQRGKE